LSPTAADGTSSIDALRSGTYLVTVSAPAYTSAAQQVTLTDGQETIVEIRIQALPATLTGRITHAVSGAPVAGATVTVGKWSVQTDAAGH
jgi:hypothetical protein